MGAGRQYTTLAAAVEAASAGDTIYIDAGTYTNDWATVSKPLTLIGVGGMAHFTSSGDIPNEKGIIVTTADLTVENLEVSGAQVADDNGAGIRYQGGNLTIRNSSFHDNQNGILGSSIPDGRVEIYNTSFIHNGTDGDRTHGIYIGGVDTLLVAGSLFQDTYVGSHLKSRAANTEVYGTRFIDGDGPTNYGIDISNGGNATIVGNYLEQEANTNNRTMINYGSEAQNPGTLVVADNTLVNHRSLAVGVYNRTDNQAIVENNVFVNVSDPIDGVADAVGNQLLTLAEYLANAAPVAADDTGSTVADAPVTIDVLANDSDADGDAFAIAAVGAAAHGSVTENGDGTLTYTPEAGFVGDDSFTYTINDGQGGSDIAQVAVAVTAPPPTPPAADVVQFDAALFSSYAGNQDQVRNQTVLDDGATVGFAGNTWRKMAFDYTLTADTMLSFDFRSPVEGEVHGIGFDNDNLWNAELYQVYGTQTGPWAGNGDLYTGNGDWQSFAISIGEYLGHGDKLYLTFMNDHDSGARNGESYYRNLRVYEAGDNLAPTAVDDSAGTEAGVAVTLDVLANDSDANGDAFAISAVGSAAHGSVTENGDGTLTYTPDAGFVGDDSFTYTIDDGQGGSDSAQVAVAVAAASPPADDIVRFDATLFSSYAVNQDQAANQTILDDGATVGFAGNTWRKMAFDYTLTTDTMLSFDFRSPVEGEVHGIGFDNDNLWNAELYQVSGTQSGPWAGSGDLYTGNGDWQSFTVNVGAYLGDGDKLYLTFLNDHDDGARNSESYYRNLRVYEAGDEVALLGVSAGADDTLIA
jgi:hypothetical protein